MATLYNYTAAYTVNQTGFGILTANKDNKISWAQYSTARQTYVDSM
jgi:hypothetical protein